MSYDVLSFMKRGLGNKLKLIKREMLPRFLTNSIFVCFYNVTERHFFQVSRIVICFAFVWDELTILNTVFHTEGNTISLSKTALY